jgi:CRP-like cAMP-binding protein
MPSAPTSCQNCPYLRHSLMGTCQLSEIAHISGSKVSQQYQRGQVIYQEGNSPAGLYCINQGKVKVSKQNSEGKEQIVKLRKEGDVLGFQALTATSNHCSSAVALTDCVVCMIPRSDFFSVIAQNSQFSHALMHLLSAALGESEKNMLHIAYKPVRGRLAEALVRLYHFFQPATPDLFSIPISREDLAALMSTAKETASRLLSDFRDEGLVATRGSRITVLDLEKLQKISELHS